MGTLILSPERKNASNLPLLDEPILVRGTAVFHVPLLSTLTSIMLILK
jgi:hypothetical protein